MTSPGSYLGKLKIKEISNDYNTILNQFLFEDYNKNTIRNTNKISKLYNAFEYDLNTPINIKCSEIQWNELQESIKKYLHNKSKFYWELFTIKYNEIVSESCSNNEDLLESFYNWDTIKDKFETYLECQSESNLQILIDTYKRLKTP